MRILNLHGLGGSGINNNFRTVGRIFLDAEITSDNNDYLKSDPEDLIYKYCCEEPYDFVIGNSFGGFLAYIIGAELGSKTLLTNPCIPPADYASGFPESYKFNETLEKLWKDYQGKNTNCHILLGMKDVVIDPYKTIRLLGDSAEITQVEDCGHHLTGPAYEDWMHRQLAEFHR